MVDIVDTDLTTGVVNGTGVFDLMMKATKAHLEQEYKANRIKNTEYTQVYLGAMQAAMNASVQFLLGRDTSSKQAALLAEQALAAVKQQAKMDAEIALLQQKKFTEEAQILDTVNSNPVAGIIGKQKGLYTAQTDGFSRDAEQKVLKMMLDTWNVRRTTDTGTDVAANGLSDANIKAVVDAARAGIGLGAAT